MIYSRCKACGSRVEKCLLPDSHRTQQAHVWVADFLLGGASGTRIRKQFKAGITKREAEKYELLKKADFERGLFIPTDKSKMLFQLIVNQYFDTHLFPKTRYPVSGRVYEQKIINELLGSCQIGNINLQCLKDARRAFQTGHKEASNAHVNRIFSVVKTIFRRAVEDGYIVSNAAEYLHDLPTTPTTPRFLDSIERAKVWTEFNTDRRVKQNAIAISHSAIRPIDLRTMEWNQVDFEQRRIRITTYKGQKPRIVFHPIDDALLEVLKERQAETHGQGKVFDWQYNHHLPESMIERSGVNTGRPKNERFTFYGLKHIYISDLINGGTPIELVSEITGVSIPTLKKHYWKPDNAVLIRAQNKINSVPSFAPKFEVL